MSKSAERYFNTKISSCAVSAPEDATTLQKDFNCPTALAWEVKTKPKLGTKLLRSAVSGDSISIFMGDQARKFTSLDGGIDFSSIK